MVTMGRLTLGNIPEDRGKRCFHRVVIDEDYSAIGSQSPYRRDVLQVVRFGRQFFVAAFNRTIFVTRTVVSVAVLQQQSINVTVVRGLNDRLQTGRTEICSAGFPG